MSTTAELMRAWRGPAILSFGFRPFFLGATIWVALAMALWIPALSGSLELPSQFDAASWHAHEFLFGYLSAVIAGFLLTAVPNWTGQLPIVGWPLGGLFVLWVGGRAGVLLSDGLPSLAVALVDLAMPVALTGFLAREIIVGKNWRNLIVLTMLGIFTISNAIFHWEAARGDYAAQGYGLRAGLGAALMMIAVIGGRIVPSFTRNWLARQGPGRLPCHRCSASTRSRSWRFSPRFLPGLRRRKRRPWRRSSWLPGRCIWCGSQGGPGTGHWQSRFCGSYTWAISSFRSAPSRLASPSSCPVSSVGRRHSISGWPAR